MKITKELLERYASGLCGPDEIHSVEAWLSSSEMEASFPAGFDVERHKRVNWEVINEKVWAPREVETRSLRSQAWLGRWAVAASFIVACGIVLWFYKGSRPDRRVESVAQLKVISTRAGEKKQVRLGDGSLVLLNAGSELQLPISFADSVRMIYLKGEAFLQVAKDASKPFIVRTGSADVRVLGTQFNVQAFPDEDSTVVVVKEGKVRFWPRENISAGVVLTTRTKATLREGLGLKVQNVYNSGYWEWKDNKLAFDNQRMDQIARLLHRWYDVEVKLGSPQIADERFTGEFVNQPVEYVVEKLSYVLDFKYKISGKQILIY